MFFPPLVWNKMCHKSKVAQKWTSAWKKIHKKNKKSKWSIFIYNPKHYANVGILQTVLILYRSAFWTAGQWDRKVTIKYWSIRFFSLSRARLYSSLINVMVWQCVCVKGHRRLLVLLLLSVLHIIMKWTCWDSWQLLYVTAVFLLSPADESIPHSVIFLICKSLWIKASAKWINVSVGKNSGELIKRNSS